MSHIIDKLYKQANYCIRNIEYTDISKFFKLEIEEFKKFFNALKSIRDPNLGEKQWDAIKLIF